MGVAFLSIKFHEDMSNRPYVDGLSSAIEKAGWQTICIARDVEMWGGVQLPPAELMRQTFGEIDRSDLVVVELSEKGVGLGIEAGYAHARGKPIVTIAKEGSDISTTLRGISMDVVLFEDVSELSGCFVGLLERLRPYPLLDGTPHHEGHPGRC